VAVLAARHRIPVGAYQLLVLLSTALTSCAVWLAGPASALALASMYAFVVIDCIFFSWLAMVRQVVALLVGAGIAFAATDVPIGWRLLSMSSAVSVAVVVSWLIRRADEAETDALTTLLNRRGFDRSLDEAITRAGRDAQPLSLALLDLDHFKQVNDSLGHGMGDQLLVSVTRAWAQAIGPGQVLARLGGDEFAVIMPGEPADAARTVQRLRSMLPGRRTCSAGLALHEAGDSRSMLGGRADAALYDAKRGGRDRIGQATTRRSGSATCGARCPAASCSWTTSRWSRSPAATRWDWRRLSAGVTRSAACSLPGRSCPGRSPARSCTTSGTGSRRTPSPRRPPGGRWRAPGPHPRGSR